MAEQKNASGEGEAISMPLAMRRAAEGLAELLRCDVDSVTSVKPSEDGWDADVEVTEIERVPPTTSVMATYRVRLNGGGELMAYERTRRYTRAQLDRRR